MKFEIAGPISKPIAPPIKIVANGTNMISTFVFPVISFPISIPIKLAINAPIGSPGPVNTMLPFTNTLPANILLANAPIKPAIPAEIVTNGDALYFTATPTPIPAPVNTLQTFPIKISIFPI